MTRVDFYILPDAEAKGRQLLACRLAEKAVGLGHQVYIHTASQAQAASLDNLLWTFRAGSFVPHGLYPGDTDEGLPVLIGHDAEPQGKTDVLINLAPEVPLFFSRFSRVTEVVNADEEQRRLGRERFRFYRERGYPLQSHDLAR